MATGRFFKAIKSLMKDPEIEAKAPRVYNNIKDRNIADDCAKMLAKYQSLCDVQNNQPGFFGRRRLQALRGVIDAMQDQSPVEAFKSLFEFYEDLNISSSRLAGILDSYFAKHTGLRCIVSETPFCSLSELNAGTQRRRYQLIRACLEIEKQHTLEGVELVEINKKNQ